MQVAFLRKTLGAAGVPCPEVNIGTEFNSVVQFALGVNYGNFNAYQDDLHWLLCKGPSDSIHCSKQSEMA